MKSLGAIMLFVMFLVIVSYSALLVIHLLLNVVRICCQNIWLGKGRFWRATRPELKEEFNDFLIQMLLVFLIPVVPVLLGVRGIIELGNVFSTLCLDWGEFYRDFSIGNSEDILDIFNTLVSQDKVQGDVSVSVAHVLTCGCVEHSPDKGILSVPEVREHFRALINDLHVSAYPTSGITYYSCKAGNGKLTIGYPDVQVNNYKYKNEDRLSVRFLGRGKEFRKLMQSGQNTAVHLH